MTRRNSHLSLAGPKKRAGEPQAGRFGGEMPPSPDPAMDMLTAWVDSIIRDLDGLTRAMRAWTENARRDYVYPPPGMDED